MDIDDEDVQAELMDVDDNDDDVGAQFHEDDASINVLTMTNNNIAVQHTSPTSKTNVVVSTSTQSHIKMKKGQSGSN